MKKVTACVAALSVLLPLVALAQQRSTRPDRIDDSARVHYQRGLELFANEYWDDAAAAFSKSIELDPDFALAHYWLGRARLSGGKYQASIAALSHCREMYLQMLGQRAGNQVASHQRRQEQLRDIQESIREQQSGPPSQKTQYVISQLQMMAREIQMGDRDSGVDFYLRPPAFVSLSLGSAYFRAEDFANAEKYFRESIETNPKQGEAHNNLAVVCFNTGRVEEAQRHVRLAEQSGYRVSSRFKEDLELARKKMGG